MEKSSFKPGNATGNPPKLTPNDASGKDEYSGGYRDQSQSLSEQEKFGTNLLPVKNPGLPAKGLKSVGG